MSIPIHSLEKGQLIAVNFKRGETRHFAPGTSRVGAILIVFGGNKKGREECATWLAGGKFLHGHALGEIVKGNLKRGVRSARAL